MPTPYGFTTWEKIEQLYAQRGIESIMDDVHGDVHTNTQNMIISDAEETVMLRLSQYHSAQACIGNRFVESRCTWIAAWLLSHRRGNEFYFQSLYDIAIRELDALATGELPALPEIPLRFDSLPAMSNFIIDDWFTIQKIRVQPTISVGGTFVDQHVNYGWYWGWL